MADDVFVRVFQTDYYFEATIGDGLIDVSARGVTSSDAINAAYQIFANAKRAQDVVVNGPPPVVLPVTVDSGTPE